MVNNSSHKNNRQYINMNAIQIVMKFIYLRLLVYNKLHIRKKLALFIGVESAHLSNIKSRDKPNYVVGDKVKLWGPSALERKLHWILSYWKLAWLKHIAKMDCGG